MHSIQTRVEALAECLCTEVSKNGPALCFCGVVAGETVALDRIGECDDEHNGMAWVRLTTAYPSQTIGRVDTTIRNCAGGIGFEVEIGVMRLAPSYGTDLEHLDPPTEAEELAAARIATDDMIALFRAVQCCLGDDYIAGAYLPVGPQGGVVGGRLTVMLSS